MMDEEYIPMQITQLKGRILRKDRGPPVLFFRIDSVPFIADDTVRRMKVDVATKYRRWDWRDSLLLSLMIAAPIVLVRFFS